MKYFLPVFFLALFIPYTLLAQVDREPPENMESPTLRVQSPNRIFGKVLDNNQKGIQSASLQLFVRKPGGDSIVAAQLSKPNGDFNFENLPPADSFRIVISALGFGIYDRFIVPESQGTPGVNHFQRDLGHIVMD